MKCPFCEMSYWPAWAYSREDAIIHHVQREHSANIWVCFCGDGFGMLTEAKYNDPSHCFVRHLDDHGGLEAHAQDFLIGVKNESV